MESTLSRCFQLAQDEGRDRAAQRAAHQLAVPRQAAAEGLTMATAIEQGLVDALTQSSKRAELEASNG